MADEQIVEKVSKKDLDKEKLIEIKDEESRILSDWRKSQSTGQLIQKGVYYEASQYIRMVASGDSFGCILLGAGGLGKSYMVTTLLSKEGIDYRYCDSFSTPLSVYVWMFEKRDKLLVFDDVQSLLSDKRAISYLKSALWSPDGKGRVIHNLTTKQPKDEFGDLIPNHFEFTGGIIMMTNELNRKNPHIQALLTRINFAEINLTYEQKVEIMRDILAIPYKDLSLSERQKCFDKIEEKGRVIMRDLNFRTLIRLYQYFIFARKNGDMSIFERLSDKMFKEQDEDFIVEVVKELENRVDLPARMDKEKEFVKITGKSKSTYHRKVSELGLTRGDAV